MPHRVTAFARAALLLALASAAGGCHPASDLSSRLEAAEWRYSGCSDIVLMAFSADETLAVSLQLEVDTTELPAPATYSLQIGDGLAEATLYDGHDLDESLFCSSISASTVDTPEVARSFGASSGAITLNVVPGINGGRTASAAVRTLTFLVGEEAVSIDLNIDPVVVGQY
jgi:hypothetical protein